MRRSRLNSLRSPEDSPELNARVKDTIDSIILDQLMTAVWCWI